MKTWLTPLLMLSASLCCAAPAPETVLVVERPLPADADILGVDAVVLPLLKAGRSSLPGDSSVFATQPLEIPWAEFAQSCHEADTLVFGAIDILRWSDTDDSSGLVALRPDLFETDAGRHIVDTRHPQGHASIWQPEVGELIRSFLKATAETLPELDGLLITCGYPGGRQIGVSDKARAACIRTLGTDPADIDAQGNTNWEALIGETMTAFLTEAIQAYGQAQPDDALWVAASPEVYRPARWTPKQMGGWAEWLSTDLLDGCIVMGPWEDDGRGGPDEAQQVGGEGLPGSASRRYAASLGMIARIDPLPYFAPAVPTLGRSGRIDLRTTVDALSTEGPVPNLAVIIDQPEDLARGVEVLRSFEPME